METDSGGLRFNFPGPLSPFLRVGTCSWKYDSWKGLIYQKDKAYRPLDYLPDYARRLDTVEVDQWFWSLFPGGIKLPDPAVVRAYAASVPESFRFTVKAPNVLTLTHPYAERGAGEARALGMENPHFLDPQLLAKFLDILSPLGPKLGPVMFQFKYLNKKKMPSLVEFLDRLQGFFSEAPRGQAYAVETRNPNYLTPVFFDFLKRHDLRFVWLEGYFMPPISEIFEKFRPLTAPFSVIRLQGPDRQDMEASTGGAWDRILVPRPASLAAAARIVRFNARRKVLTFVNLNNHFEGSAPLSIQRLAETLGRPSSSGRTSSQTDL